MPHNFFEGNTYKYILTGIDVASRYKVDLLGPKNQAKLHLCWKQSIQRVACLNISRSSSVIMGSEFKNEVTKLLEKHNVEIRRATTKYKHIHRAFVETFNKQLAKLLFKRMDAKELQDPEKVSTIWVKKLNKTMNKINNTVSSMIGMKPKMQLN